MTYLFCRFRALSQTASSIDLGADSVILSVTCYQFITESTAGILVYLLLDDKEMAGQHWSTRHPNHWLFSQLSYQPRAPPLEDSPDSQGITPGINKYS
jgi:hypothetical protein